MNIFDWVWDNRQWVFSGIGVPLVVAVVALIFRRKRHSPGIPTTITHAPITAPVSTALSTGGAYPTTTLTPEYITETIDAAPPLGREHVAQQFLGVLVEWDLPFNSATKSHDGSIRLRFRFPGKDFGIPAVRCTCDLSANSFLRFTHEGSIIRVRGIIEEADQYDITLKDVSLAMLQPSQPKNRKDK